MHLWVEDLLISVDKKEMMMKNTLLTLVCALMAVTSLSAQRGETLFDDLDMTGVWFSWDYNFSYYEDDYSYVRGWDFGLEFNEDFTMGWGWYNFRDEPNIDGTTERFDMKYNGIVLGIAPRSDRAFHPRLGFLAGSGRVWLEDNDRDRVFVFQPSGGFEVNVFRWFRVGLEGGYRLVAGNDLPGVADSDLSAPFGQLDLRFGISW